MYRTGDPPETLGSTGLYHHDLPPNQVPYHGEQIPTTSHPSWHNVPHPGFPTPPYLSHPPQPPQQHPNYSPMPPQTPQHQHPQMTPQALSTQQQQVQQQQHRSAYSSPSPSRGPSAPVQNQKNRTEQWINNSAWSYSQSSAPTVVPSVMSYQGDDRMSMLSVNTAMTNHFPDSQRCFSSNGSTCENVNPELMKISLSQNAEQAMRAWFSTPDPIMKLNMARTIREFVRREQFALVDQENMPNYIQQTIRIVYDGLKGQPIQLSPQYYTELFYYLLDILMWLTILPNVTRHMHLVIQLFTPTGNEPHFRDLICNLLKRNFPADQNWKLCSNKAFQIFFNIIKNVTHDGMRAEFAKSMKFDRLLYTLLEYFSPLPLPEGHVPHQEYVTLINPTIIIMLRFIISKDTILKNCLIWTNGLHDQMLPKNSLIVILQRIMLRCHEIIASRPSKEVLENPDLHNLVQIIVQMLEFLCLLLHDSDAINGFTRAGGIESICTVVQYPNIEITRSGFKCLRAVSHAKDLGTISNEKILKIINIVIRRIRESLDDYDIVYSGTGFLSNAVADKPHVKEIAINNDAIMLLYTIIRNYPRLNEVKEARKRNLVRETMCNILRTLNNFFMMWIQTQNREAKTAGPTGKQMQIYNFMEPEILKRLMNCLSDEGIDTSSLLELRSTILRFFILFLKMHFVPKDDILNVIDDSRKESLVGHICAAFSWAVRQPANPGTQITKQQLVERAISLLHMLMENCGAEKQVAQCSYSIPCPLELLKGDQIKPLFIYNVLSICDKILEHCPTLADVWTIDRSMLETFTNHREPEIVKAANSLLSRFPPDNDPLAGIFSSSTFF